MKKRITEYLIFIDTKLEQYHLNNDSLNNEILSKEIKDHLIQISFFQHERLIHLIVTVLFAILTVGSIFFTIVTSNTASFFLTIFLLILLIPYIKHYYLLENGVQKMYKQYDTFVKFYNKPL